MQGLVVSERTPVREALPADAARIRLLARVDSHVDGQVTAQVEVFPTELANVWLLSRVCSHVLPQLLTARERFLTY